MHAPGAFRLGRRRCHRRSLPGADPPGRGLRRRRRRGRRDGSRLRGSGTWGIAGRLSATVARCSVRCRASSPSACFAYSATPSWCCCSATSPDSTTAWPSSPRPALTAVGDLSPSSTLDLLMMIEPSLASKLRGPCLLSVVVPVFNEEAVLPAFHQRLGAVLGDLGDDCGCSMSTTAAPTWHGDPRPATGRRPPGGRGPLHPQLRQGTGDERRAQAVARRRGDRHRCRPAGSPELIPQMLDAWIGGAEMVNMRRRNRAGESWLKRASASAFYRLINRLSEVPIPRDVGDFRLLDRRVVDLPCELPEGNRFMKDCSPGSVSARSISPIAAPPASPATASGATGGCGTSPWKASPGFPPRR